MQDPFGLNVESANFLVRTQGSRYHNTGTPVEEEVKRLHQFLQQPRFARSHHLHLDEEYLLDTHIVQSQALGMRLMRASERSYPVNGEHVESQAMTNDQGKLSELIVSSVL
jgi:hypothetical protein